MRDDSVFKSTGLNQRTQVQFPGPTWWHKTNCNSSPGNLTFSSGLHGVVQTYREAKHLPIYIKNTYIKKLPHNVYPNHKRIALLWERNE